MAAFIFDMDGTMVDNAGFHTRAWLALMEEVGVQVAAEELHRWSSGQTNGQIVRRLVGDNLSNQEIAGYAERKESLYRAAYRPHLRLVKGLDRFLRQAQQLAIPMAVATSAERANIDFVLGGLGIESLFAAVVGSEDVQQGKPHPESFLTAASRLGVAPEQCLVFEDSLSGIEAAWRAGMRAVAVSTSVDAQEFRGLANVDRVIPDFSTVSPEALVSAGASSTS